jgi:hypothetical protein
MTGPTIAGTGPAQIFHQKPDPGEPTPPSASERTDAAIDKYTQDLHNGASPSVLQADREAIDAAVATEIRQNIDALPRRDKTDRKPLGDTVQELGDDILSRNQDVPATTREAVEGAISDYKSEATTWAPEDRGKVDAYIRQAMDAHPGDIKGAFEQLRDMRWRPGHFYDTNLAIAADYLRARWETEKYGRNVASAEVSIYLDKKQDNEIPQNGPGPVSPYSELQKEYMYKGIDDQWDSMSFWDQLAASGGPTDEGQIGQYAAAAFENDLS